MSLLTLRTEDRNQFSTFLKSDNLVTKVVRDLNPKGMSFRNSRHPNSSIFCIPRIETLTDRRQTEFMRTNWSTIIKNRSQLPMPRHHYSSRNRSSPPKVCHVARNEDGQRLQHEGEQRQRRLRKGSVRKPN